MLYQMKASDRLNALADRIVTDTEHTFNMGSASTCAYSFSCRLFGEEWRGDNHYEHLAKMLQISEIDANNIYNATHFEGNRDAVAKMLRLIAREYAS